MKVLNCIIIEDEPIAAEIVQSYIEQVSFLKLEGICSDALMAFDLLKNRSIDLIFLDIHLPTLKGIDFLRAINTNHPKVIITSAYKEYALEGFEFEITDYLLKPFSFVRFLKAVNRLNRIGESNIAANRQEPEFRFFNVNKKQLKIYLEDILYVESLKDYVRIYTKNQSIVTKFQLGELETFLDHTLFIRVHRSFLVSKSKIRSFSFEELEVEGKIIPIGRSYSSIVKKILGSDYR